MKWHSISEVAKIVNRSRQAVYKKIKRLTLEEKLALGNNLMEDGQILLSNEGIKLVFNLSINDNQVDQPVVGQVDKVDIQVVKTTEKVDIQVDTEVVAVLRNQLTDKEKEVVRLDNLMTNLLSQLEEERRQRGEDRIRTDTIIMKLAHDLEATRKSALAIEAKVDALGKKPEKDSFVDVLNQPTLKIEPWTPPARVADPLEGLGFLQKIWVQFVEPQKMRRYDS